MPGRISRPWALAQQDGVSYLFGDTAAPRRDFHWSDLDSPAEGRSFFDKQIALLKTFADQAVIAIENVRLFQEFQEGMQNFVKRWSIKRQRLRCLASSAGHRRTCSRCLDAIVASATRVCGVDDVILRLLEGNVIVSARSFWFHTSARR